MNGTWILNWLNRLTLTHLYPVRIPDKSPDLVFFHSSFNCPDKIYGNGIEGFGTFLGFANEREKSGHSFTLNFPGFSG